MTNFHGFCSYPHGGWAVFGLIMACAVALSCNMYSAASCRFAFVDFTSNRGDFGEFYLDPTPDGGPVNYRAGIGLFQWLTPFESDDWSDGQCAGYTTLQRDTFSDHKFEVARLFSVLSVLGGISVTAWSFFLACISLGKFQIWILSTILIGIAIFCGFMFIFFLSELCQDLVSYQDENYETECTLDQGGLVAIAAVIMWCVATLISIMYIKPRELDLQIANGRITNAYEERRAQRKEERKLKQIVAQRKLHPSKKMTSDSEGLPPSSMQHSSSSLDYRGRPSRSRGPSVQMGDDGMGAEVQLNRAPEI